MANFAPGNRSSTAWARTWAVEWRSTARPWSESAVTIPTLAPSGSGRTRSYSAPSTVAATAAPADAGGEVQSRGAVGQLARGAVGQGDGDHGGRGYRRPGPAQSELSVSPARATDSTSKPSTGRLNTTPSSPADSTRSVTWARTSSG